MLYRSSLGRVNGLVAGRPIRRTTATVTNRISLALVLHNHQPVGNFGWVIAEAFDRAYLPMLVALERHPTIGAGLHYSGPLLEWLRVERPDFIDRLAALVGRGQVELLGGGYYEPVLASLPERDRLAQLTRMSDELLRISGRRPAGAWLAERVWEPDVATSLVDAGYRYEDGSLYTFPTGTTWGGAAGERMPLIQGQVVDDGGTTGGEAKLQFVAQKGLSFANAPSNNLALGTVLRNRGADALEKVNTTMQVYDTLGNAHDVNITFEKVLEIEDPSNSKNVMVASPDTWKWYVTGTQVDAAGTDPTTGLPLGAGWGYVKFDATGGFRSVETRRSNPLAPAGFNPLGVNKSFIDQASKAVVMFDWNNGAGDNQIVQLDFSRMTELQDGNTAAESKNDGFATGTLTSFTIGADGVILGQYSNGKTNPLAQVALATFPNVGGLTQVGSNMFVESANSGFAQIGEPRTGSRGSINAGQIEMSNVDLAQQFTDMIKAQRGFQANSRIITTSDEMLQDLVNLKR